MIRMELPGNGAAAFTTRADGNLSTLRGAGHEHGLTARGRLCEELGLSWLCAGPQVHGSIVQRVRRRTLSGGEPDPTEADGRATGLERVGMMVLTADCVPILVGSERAVGAVHAGWRGLAAGVIEEGVGALRELGADARPDLGADARPDRGAGELVALIGPCAGPCCYEVGPEVRDAFAGAHSHGRNLDLAGLAREQLRAAGVRRIEHLDLCTICDERFFSHRREADGAGRQAGIAWLSS